jgi:hypothetical protein
MALIQELPGTSLAGVVDPADVKSPSEVSDDAALKIVTRDAATCRSWIESRYFNIRWIEIDVLYQSPPTLRTWEGTQTPKANIAKFTVATHVNAINSKLIGGLFYEEPPFNLIQRPGADVNAVRAIEEISAYQLDAMNFKQEVKYGFFSCLLNGTGIWKWGWKEYYETDVEFEPMTGPIEYQDVLGQTQEIPTEESDKFTMKEVEHLRAHPYFENCDIRTVLVDPGCRTPDIRDAKFVIHEFPVTYRDLIKMKDEVYYDEKNEPIYRYNLPSEDEIRAWFEPPQAAAAAAYGAQGQYASNITYGTTFVPHAAPLFSKTTEDPLDEPLILQERWDRDKVLTVLNGRRLIRNERNPFGCIPFYSVNWWMIQDCFWGLGLGTALGGEQRLQQGFINSVADMGTLTMNQPIIRSRSANINTQQVRARLGGFIDVDGDANKALHPMDLPKIQSELFTVVEASEARTESTSGASDLFTMGAAPLKGKTSAGRTATGAGGLMQAAVDRLGGLVEDFNRQVFQPWLWQMYDLNRWFLPPSVYREVLNDQLGDAFKANIKQYITGKKGIKDFQVLAGAHLAARQQMAQSMPLLMQYFGNPALAQQLADVQGVYVDFGELLHMLTDVSGWGSATYYSIIKPLTAQMKAQRQAQNPAAQKMQTQTALQSQRASDKANLSQQEWTQRAAGDIIRHSLEQAGGTEELTGAPGGPGLGGQELPA